MATMDFTTKPLALLFLMLEGGQGGHINSSWCGDLGSFGFWFLFARFVGNGEVMCWGVMGEFGKMGMTASNVKSKIKG